MLMREVLQRIATGPTMSKDLTVEQACRAMRLVLSQQADPVQSALFLIALRMKRETESEMQGVTEAILEGVNTVAVDCDALITMVDPYDGYIRSLPASPFIPAVLTACGVSVVTHGIESIGPKHGLSVKRVLQAAGISVDSTTDAAAEKLSAADSAWCYLDQTEIAPELANLQLLRDQMVKRPCITTIEKGLMPLKAKQRNHFITGYVHKAYPDVYADLASSMGFDSAGFIKGIEGGVVPTVAQVSRYFQWSSSDSTLDKIRIVPADIGIDRETRAVDLPDGVLSTDACGRPSEASIAKLATDTAERGIAALKGDNSLMHECIFLGASVALASFQQCGISQASEQVRTALTSGAALEAFMAVA